MKMKTSNFGLLRSVATAERLLAPCLQTRAAVLFAALAVAFVAQAGVYTLSPDRTSYNGSVQAGAAVYANSDTCSIVVPDGQYAVLSLHDEGFRWHHCQRASFRAYVDGLQLKLGDSITLDGDATLSISATATGDSYRDPYVISRYGSVAGVSFPIYTYRDYPYTDYYYIQDYSVSVSYRRKLPDLYVSEVSLSATAVAVDENVRLDFTVRNGGRLAATVNSVARVYDGSRLVADDVTIGALASGASSDHAVELPRLSAGNHDIKVVVDASGRIDEADEANNEAVSSVRAYTRTAVGVTFDLNGGGSPVTVSVVAGNLLTILPDVRRTGYDFLGWWTDVDGGSEIGVDEKITESRTFYAHWEPRSTEIVFNRRSGSGGTRTAFATFDASLPSITPPTRTGYDFAGYWTEPNGGGEQIYSAAGEGTSPWRIDQREAVLYAKWNGRPVKLAFDRQGGQGGALSADAVYCEVPPQISVPSRTGWLFQGYFTKPGGEGVRYYDENGVGLAVVAETDDLTIYAHWLPVSMECSLTLDLQGGTGEESVKATYAEVFPTVAPPVRDGYAFKGYFAGPDGSGKQYTNADGTCATIWDGPEPIRLFAKWEKAFRVVLDPNGGTGASVTNYFTQPTWALAANAFTSNGCVFAGWALEPHGAPVFPDGAVISKEQLGYGDDPDAEPATLYAAWGKPLASDLFPEFSFLTGGTDENGGWNATDGKLTSSDRSGNSWLCAMLECCGSFGCVWGVAGKYDAEATVTVASPFVTVCSSNLWNVEESLLPGHHLVTLAIDKPLLSLNEQADDEEVGDFEGLRRHQANLQAMLDELSVKNSELMFRELGGRYDKQETIQILVDVIQQILQGADYYSLQYYLVDSLSHEGYDVYYLRRAIQNHSSAGDEIIAYCERIEATIADIMSIDDYIATHGVLDSISLVEQSLVSFIQNDGSRHGDAIKAEIGRRQLQRQVDVLAESIGALMFDEISRSLRYGWGWIDKRREVGETIVRAIAEYQDAAGNGLYGSLSYFLKDALSNSGYDVYYVDLAIQQQSDLRSACDRVEAIFSDMRKLASYISDCGVVALHMIDKGGNIGQLPTPDSRDGYTFEGWFDEDGNKVDESTKVTEDMLVHAKWSLNKYSISFNANGGASVAAQTVEHGERIALPPAPVREGYVFEGWYCDADGNEAAEENAVATTNTTFFALWTPDVSSPVLEKAAEANFDWNSYSGDSQDASISPCLYEAVEGAAPALASVYDGYLIDARGDIAGTIQVKVGKPNAKKGNVAAVKATVQLARHKKMTLKAKDGGKAAIATDGPTTVALVGGEVCEVTLGEEGLSGFYGDYGINGARNFFTSKDKGEQNSTNDILAKWLGPVNAAWSGGTASASIGKKGKAKVAVTLADGTKATATAQLLVGKEWLCAPVVVTKKINLAFTLWLPLGGGEALAEGLPEGAKVGKPGTLKSGAKFHVGKTATLWSQVGALTDYLPDGLPVKPGARWTVAGGARAGKVAYLRGTTEIDEAKLGANPSALKLTYKAKDGSFKGSFKVYADANGRLKATKVDVTGVVIDGIGYGFATIKRVDAVVPATID